MKIRFLFSALLVIQLAACVSTPVHETLANAAPVFSPQAFFNGTTIGEGALKIDFSGTKHTHVVGHGNVEPDGTLVLVQIVKEGDKPTATRTWRIQQTGKDRFTGSLSDAEGPISAYVRGNLLHIRFRTKKGGLDTEQWLYLQPGGRVALNRMVVRKLGIPVASLDETITKEE